MGPTPWAGPVVPMATMQENSEAYQSVDGECPCSEGGFPTTSPSQTRSNCVVRVSVVLVLT